MVLLSTYDYNDYFGAFSKYGSIRLGKDGEKPKYNYPSWLSMLFGAGMGIGLSFMESLNRFHILDPLTGKAGTEESAKLAMQYSFFHWGLFPWSLYAMVALTIAYFTFRKQKVALSGYSYSII